MTKTTISPSDDGAAADYPVFVETNIDTRLTVVVSDKDTVEDLIMKIEVQHPHSFPTVGKVQVNGLQVKRRGIFFHLPKSISVKTAFVGAKYWYIYADASCTEKQSLNMKQHLGKPDSSNQLALPWVKDDTSNNRRGILVDKSHNMFPKHHDSSEHQPDHERTGNPDSNKRSCLEVHKHDVGNEGIISKKRLRDTHHDSSMEQASESGPTARKKHKTERNVSTGNTFEKESVLINGRAVVTSKIDATNDETFHMEQGKSKNATPDGLFAGTMNDDHASIISSEKKTVKKKKKRGMTNEINNNSEQDAQQGLAEPSEFRKKEKHRELVQEAYEEIKAPFPTMSCSKHEEDDLKKNSDHSTKNIVGYDGNMSEQVDVCERNRDVLMNQGPEVSLHGRVECDFPEYKDVSYEEPLLSSQKKSDPDASKWKGNSAEMSTAENMNESFVKHDNDAPYATEKEEKNLSGANSKEISERNTMESTHMTAGREGADLLESRAEQLLSTKTNKGKLEEDVLEASMDYENANGTNKEKKKKKEKERKKKKKEKKAKKCAADEYTSVMKLDTDAVIQSTSVMPNPASDGMTAGRGGADLLESEAEQLLQSETNEGKLDGEGVIEASKDYEDAIGTNKEKKKKKKDKKSAARDEDASVIKLDTDAVIQSPLAMPNPASDGRLLEIPQENTTESSHMTAKGAELLECGMKQLLPAETNKGNLNEEGVIEASKDYENTIGANKEKKKKKKKKDKKSAARDENASVMKLDTDAVIQPPLDMPNPASDGRLSELPQNNTMKSSHMAAGREGGADLLESGAEKLLRSETSESKLDEEGVVEASKDYENANGTNKDKKKKKFKKSAARDEDASVMKLATDAVIQSPLAMSNPEMEKSNLVEHVLSQNIPKDVRISEVPGAPVIENMVQVNADSQVDVSNGKGEEINFLQHFVRHKNHNEAALTNHVKGTRKSESSMKSKNQEKVDVPSSGTLLSQQKSLLSANKHGDENNDVISSKYSTKVSVDKMKAPNSSPINRSALASKKNNGSLIESSTNSDASVRSHRVIESKKRELSIDQSDMAVGKTAAKNTGGALNNSQRMKSLLATPASIFGDESSNSSADDNVTVHSDASTRTPSDKSVSSESEGESDSSADSRKNGHNATNRKAQRRCLQDSPSSEMKKSFNEILRSSSRFMKAKVTASKYQEVADSIDFVPDSLPVD